MNLPLHGGHAPPYLVKRMIKLSHCISKVLIDEFGEHEFLKRLSDPLWFQAFGCVLGFDWHSSGLTTVVTGVLKQALEHDVHGICIAGGKGIKSTTTKHDIPNLAERNFNLSSKRVDELLYASKMAAKVDNAAIQDGYSLYHHVILFDRDGDWTVIQQGMNTRYNMARRYHWLSDNLGGFVKEPHTGIISERRDSNVLNMTSIDSISNQQLCVDLATGDTGALKSSVYKVTSTLSCKRKVTLDNWLSDGPSKCADFDMIQNYEMPRKLDWDLFRRIYDIQPKNYEQLLSIPGVGPATVRALSLIGQLIFGTAASWDDPVKYNFAHGGKDGVPYPVARQTYDKSISYLSAAIEGAEMERAERIHAIKRLAQFSNSMFNQPTS